jgi:mono/diheme cytochrome c family protein
LRHTLAAALALLAAPAFAQDAANGAELAQEYCARCHDVGSGGATKQHPPSFAAIAGYRPEEQITARILFPSLHSEMPAWSDWLNRAEVEDLTAHILSLEGS